MLVGSETKFFFSSIMTPFVSWQQEARRDSRSGLSLHPNLSPPGEKTEQLQPRLLSRGRQCSHRQTAVLSSPSSGSGGGSAPGRQTQAVLGCRDGHQGSGRHVCTQEEEIGRNGERHIFFTTFLQTCTSLYVLFYNLGNAGNQKSHHTKIHCGRNKIQKRLYEAEEAKT